MSTIRNGFSRIAAIAITTAIFAGIGSTPTPAGIGGMNRPGHETSRQASFGSTAFAYLPTLQWTLIAIESAVASLNE